MTPPLSEKDNSKIKPLYNTKKSESSQYRKKIEQKEYGSMKDVVVSFVWHQRIVFLPVERGGSAVECRTRNLESTGSNPLWYCIEDWACSFSPRRPSSLSCVNKRFEWSNGQDTAYIIIYLYLLFSVIRILSFKLLDVIF